MNSPVSPPASQTPASADVAEPARSAEELDFWMTCVGAPLALVEKASLTVLRLNASARALFGLQDTSAALPMDALVGAEASAMLSQIWSNAPPGQPGEPFLIRAQVSGQERLLMVQVTKLSIDGELYRLFTFTNAPPEGSVALAGWQENVISMLNWLPFGFEIASADDQIQFANSTFKELFGYSQDEIESIEDWWRLAYPDPDYRAFARSQWTGSIEAARRENREMTPFDLAVMTASGIERQIQFRQRSIGDFNVNLYIDVTKERAYAEQLKTLANTDPLTGLINRRCFFEKAEALFRASAAEASLGMLMLDIDHFKTINDTHGHHAGDLALTEFARRCRDVMPKAGHIARLGGEEFAVILPDADLAAATALAETIRSAIRDTPFISADASFSLSVSIGATTAKPAQETLSSAISRADKALYEAKHQGRDRVVGISA